jgi:hypothetical protein
MLGLCFGAYRPDGQSVALISEGEWNKSSDRSKAGVSVDAVNAAIEKMNGESDLHRTTPTTVLNASVVVAEWIAEQAAFGLTGCDVITTVSNLKPVTTSAPVEFMRCSPTWFCGQVDLEDEVGIDEGSITAFTALLIAFKRIESLGRGRFQIL